MNLVRRVTRHLKKPLNIIMVIERRLITFLQLYLRFLNSPHIIQNSTTN